MKTSLITCIKGIKEKLDLGNVISFFFWTNLMENFLTIIKKLNISLVQYLLTSIFINQKSFLELVVSPLKTRNDETKQEF